MRWHIFLEFLVAFLTMIAIIQLFAHAQGNSLNKIGKEVSQLGAKAELEKMAAACNLIYFSGKNANLNFSFNLPNIRTSNNVLMASVEEANLTSECFSNISNTARLEVDWVRKWF